MVKAIPLLLLLSFISAWNIRSADAQQKTWCVAKPSTDEATLRNNIKYACEQPHVDCGVLREGCPCFIPNNLMNHASVAMNLYYQANGRNEWNCNYGNSALTVLTDPSYGSCIYA